MSELFYVNFKIEKVDLVA